MADLSLTPGQELLRNAASAFVDRECPLPEVRRIGEQEAGFSRPLWEKMAALGWAGILVPPEHGGEGGSLTDAAVLYEALGRGLLPSPHLSSPVIAALLLQRSGSDTQRRMLPPIARGETIVAPAITEADYGWTAGHVRAHAAPRDGGYVLDGVKRFVMDAAAADAFVCAARTGAGVTLFLLDARAPGVSARPITSWSGDALFDVTLSSVAVPPDAVIGEDGRGWDALEPVLDAATALLCAYIAGATRRAYEMSLAYAQARVQFGQPIARFQRVQDHLVEMLNHADAARWTAFEAAWKLDEGKPGAQEAVSVAKAAASEGFYRSCEAAHHVHGGIGSEKGYGLYLYTRKSRSLYHYLGDPAHHRRRLARLLGL